jgi:hypothetical protein
MAQTKRKRRTKHRGNAAGQVEQRGRTSRPLTPEERKAERKAQSRQRRAPKPPSWRRAVLRSFFTTLGFVILMVLALNRPVRDALVLGPLAFIIYVPFGYYADSFFYRRWGAGKDRPQGGRDGR